MFGSSQDRARQLAGRKRRERISFSGSHLSHRPVSTAHNTPGQDQTAVCSDLRNARPVVIGEDLFCIPDHSHYPHLDQQIIQNEHLSRVLYDPPGPYTSSQMTSSRLQSVSSGHQYGSLGISTTNSRPSRNLTAPLSVDRLSLEGETGKHVQNGTPTLPSMPLSEIKRQLRQETAAILRGGHGDASDHDKQRRMGFESRIAGIEDDDTFPAGIEEDELHVPSGQTMPNWAILSRPFAAEFPWVSSVLQMPQWREPISSGASYASFLESLSGVEYERFASLFGPHASPSLMAGRATTARQAFFLALSVAQQIVFRNLITARGMTLLVLRETNSGTVPTSPFTILQDHDKPPVLLEHLLDATERPPLLLPPRAEGSAVYSQSRPSTTFSPQPQNQAFPLARVTSTSNSNLQQQQQHSQLPGSFLYFYFSIAGGQL